MQQLKHHQESAAYDQQFSHPLNYTLRLYLLELNRQQSRLDHQDEIMLLGRQLLRRFRLHPNRELLVFHSVNPCVLLYR